MPDVLTDYPVHLQLPVQWGDQDAFGHVNNTVYFRWFESSRIAYLERLGIVDKGIAETGSSDVGGSTANLGPILAAISCNYRRQLKYPDQVIIGTRVASIGRSSMVVEHKVWSTAQQAVVADGQSTVVAFDYVANRPRPVPDELRRKVEQLEGRKFA